MDANGDKLLITMDVRGINHTRLFQFAARVLIIDKIDKATRLAPWALAKDRPVG